MRGVLRHRERAVVIALGGALLISTPALAQFPTCMPILKPRMTLGNYHPSSGGVVTKIAAKGTFTVPFPFVPPLDPPSTGVDLLVFDANGVEVGHGGASTYDIDWKSPVTTRRGTRWVSVPWHTRIATVAGSPGVITFTTRGRLDREYPALVPALALPLRFQLLLSEDETPGVQCGEATFPGPPPVPTCTVNAAATHMSCR